MKKIKNKKGITILLFAAVGSVLILFTALILDVGRVYVYQEKLQSVADASAAAGAYAGQHTIINDWVDGSGNVKSSARVQINGDMAEAKAREIFRESLNTLNAQFTENGQPKIYFNYENDPKVSSRISKTALYEAGLIHVHVTGQIKGFLMGKPMTINRKATVYLNPDIASSTTTIYKNTVTIENNARLVIRDEQGRVILTENIN